ADYAIYRYAQILGIEGNLNEKISELRRMETEFSSSKWMPNALNELAETYVATERNAEAAAVYSRMLSRYPSDASSAHARLGMASALMDSGDKEGAVMAYKEILTMQPSSAEARLADKALREYYADRQELREYAQFLRSVPGFSIDAVEMENLSYEAAERNYLADGKLEGLKKYLKDYPGGAHNAEAWLTLGRHYQDAADKQNALAAYRELEKTGGAEYATDAYIGIMRMADNSGVRADYARRLRESGGASADVIEEADFYINEGRLSDKSAAVRTQAERRLRELAANPFSEFGARSAVALGEHLIETGRNKEALELMEEFTSSGSEHNYWVARGFIVIADAYAAMGDKYTSEEYLRSLQRNYPGNEDDIRRACSARLGK
ncbi:MAG: tetratricopeptide repeat protein, partial [Muribaculaceae bacterium]|nr:tetratricopeptide repeat protein [Muribaculaceae bacterium]